MSEVIEKFEETPDGYERTKLGMLPTEWTVGQLRDFNCEFISGGTPSRDNDEYFGGNIPWLRTSEVQNERVTTYEESITQSGLENSSAKIVSAGAVLVAMYGGGTVGNVGLLDFDAATNQACCAVIPDESVLLNEFLYQQLLFEHHRLVSYAAGASQQNLSKSDVKQFDIRVPPLPEQRRIADILSTVDEQIQQTDEIIEKTKELKRGLAQDLYGDDASDDQFPDRAPELPEGWSLRPISDLCDIGGGKTPSKSNDDYWGGTVLWASPKDFDGPLLDDTEDKITEFGVNDTSLKTYSPGNIAVVVRSGVLQHTLPVAKLISKSTVNQDVKVLQPNTDAINPEYFFQMLRTQSNRIRQRCMKTGTTVESIETSFLKKYMLRVPPQGKQEEIAGVLSNLDRKVQLEQNHLVTLQELKRGLMQDLLTGKVRVNTD